MTLREACPYQNGWIFGKVPKGGRSFPIQKFLLQILDFWTGFFWHKNDTKGYFQGMFFFNNLKRNLKKKFSWDTLGKHHYKNISVHLGIARLGGGLNPCQDGLWQLFLEEMTMYKRAFACQQQSTCENCENLAILNWHCWKCLCERYVYLDIYDSVDPIPVPIS